MIVDVIAAPVLPYANEVFSHERKYLMTLPMVPGCGAIGRVRSVAPDVFLDHAKPDHDTQWMYSPYAVTGLTRLIHSGLQNLISSPRQRSASATRMRRLSKPLSMRAHSLLRSFSLMPS